MWAEWEGKKSRAFALLQKFHHFTLIWVINHHSRVRKWSFKHHFIHSKVIQCKNDHWMTKKTFQDDSKWQGWPRDEEDQNHLHEKCPSFQHHSGHSDIILSRMTFKWWWIWTIKFLPYREAGVSSLRFLSVNLIPLPPYMATEDRMSLKWCWMMWKWEME